MYVYVHAYAVTYAFRAHVWQAAVWGTSGQFTTVYRGFKCTYTAGWGRESEGDEWTKKGMRMRSV